jgi:hypothetical protein
MTHGGFEISKNFLSFIKNHLPPNSTILELGSGGGTLELIKSGYKMISIEQNLNYLNLHHNNYCHAPLKEGWYDIEIVNDFIKEKSYDAILIDGPASGDRLKIINSKLDFSKIIFVDDMDRPRDREVFDLLKKGRNFKDEKLYGVILND